MLTDILNYFTDRLSSKYY